MGVRVSKVAQHKYVAETTFQLEEPPEEGPPVERLSHRLLVGRKTSRSTVLSETTAALEYSIPRPQSPDSEDEDPTPEQEEDQGGRMFEYSDCILDTSALEGDNGLLVMPRGGRLLDEDSFMIGASAVAALTMPLLIRNKLAHKLATHLAPGHLARVQFNYSDFKVVLTGEDYDEEMIARAGTSFTDVQLKQLMQARRNKVVKICNYSQQTLLGRSTRIKCLKLSPCEKKMVYCSNDETVLILYDLASGRELLHFDGHSDQINAVCFSPDGKHVCSASRDETIIRWDTATAKQVQVMCHDSGVMCCDYSRDGNYIVAGCQDKICKLWDARTGRKALLFALHTALIVNVAFSPDSYSVCSASADRTLMIWDVRTGKRRYTLSGHTGVVLSCAYSFDTLRVVSNDEKTLRVWNARDGKEVHTWGTHGVPSRTSAIPPDEKRPEMKYNVTTFAPSGHIVVSFNNKVVQLLDPNTGEEVISFFFRASVYCISSGNFNTIALGDASGNVHLIHLTLETDMLTLPMSAFKNFHPSPSIED